MQSQRLKRRKYGSGMLLLLMGLGAVYQSFEYTIGTAARMGPGYYPLILGILLVVFGIMILVLPDSAQDMALMDNMEEAKEQEEAVALTLAQHMRPWIAIVVSMLTFILVGKYGGLVPATFALIFIAALGDRANGVKSALFLAIGVTLAAIALFHYGLQLQFPLFTWG